MFAITDALSADAKFTSKSAVTFQRRSDLLHLLSCEFWVHSMFQGGVVQIVAL